MYQQSNSLGLFIKSKQIVLKLTQKQLADKVKYSSTYLCNIELGRRIPSPELLQLLAIELDVNEDYLDYLAGKFPRSLIDCKYSISEFLVGLNAFRGAQTSTVANKNVQ